MKTAERTVRIIAALVGSVGILLLFLPHVGISVDTVMSGSMEPALRTGGIILTDTRTQVFEPGDIITYQVEDNIVSHRVVGLEGDCYRTKGDANDSEDTVLIKQSQIRGKVIFMIPLLGYAAVFMKQKTVFALLAVMILEEFVFFTIQWKGERSRKRRKHI